MDSLSDDADDSVFCLEFFRFLKTLLLIFGFGLIVDGFLITFLDNTSSSLLLELYEKAEYTYLKNK